MRPVNTIPLVLILIITLTGGCIMMAAAANVEIVLNGLKIQLDADSGGIVSMEYDGPGKLLSAEFGEASLLDMACPIPQFEPLRVGTPYSNHVEIKKSASSVVIAWSDMGCNRNMDLGGPVSASVRLEATPDGRSIIMTCEVHNNSQRPIRQVLFPDFAGLLPVAGPDATIFKTGGFGSAPFRELKLSESDEFYAQTNAYREYKSGGMFSDMWMRWMDLGGLNGGFSLFPKLWGWDERSSVLLHLSPTTNRLRLMNMHPITITPGESWKSEEWVFTPHQSGWAKGIEVYREFARAKMQRKEPLPKSVQEGIGFRSAWMCENQVADGERDVVWSFKDIPTLGREAKEHGLYEMVLWATHPGFTLPTPPPFPHLGTEAELTQAIAQCRQMGVGVAPFVSILQANKATGPRYGLQVPESGGWTYHTEMIPNFNPPYAGAYACAQVDTANPQWQADALEFLKHLADIGMTSLGWDQFHSVQQEPNIPTLLAQFRQYARAIEPQSALCAEELWNIENDCDYLDFTWNWGGYRDCQAYTSVFPSPKRNININRSVWEVKRGFLDGFFLNVWPTKPGGINGSDTIANNPALSQALKRCAKFKTQFLPYFTNGIFVADCILQERTPGTQLTARTLNDRVMMLFTNEGAATDLRFNYDLTPWIPSASGKYELKMYDQDGGLQDNRQIEAIGYFTAPAVEYLETRACEIIAITP